jgi:hypothetical protein
MKYVGGAAFTGAAIVLTFLAYIGQVSAVSSNLVISQLQLGASGASKHEFVQLYNNSDGELDITDWCLTYSDYKDETRVTLRCFAKPEGADGLKVPPYGNILVASQTYPLPTGVATSERFAGSSTDLSGARGHVRISDSFGVEVDKVAWDNKANTPPLSPEGLAATTPAVGNSIARAGSPVLIDTDNNAMDFHEQISAPLSSEVFEYVAPKEIIDLCQMDGVQETMPEGYDYDEAGNCELIADDVCLNIDKIQLGYPEGMLADGEKGCFVDMCLNLESLQVSVPTGYVQFEGTCTKLEDRELLVTEVFANASGADTGREYIEIFNPNSDPVPLDGYVLQIGKTFEKSYALTEVGNGEMIAPNQYLVFSDELGYTLLNTGSGVRLVAPAGNLVSETSYQAPADDMSWSLFANGWQYTNQPTPGEPNVASLVEEDVDDEEVLGVATLAPCSAGKYRHPVTNRCRNIETDANILASCEADEYRNPETNRCRKLATLASATLASCEDGYERNPDTNRCRKVADAATSSLRPCEDGYERNPDTNRCRAASTSSNLPGAFQASDESASTLNWPVVGMVTSVAVGYAVYEWRRELAKGFRAISSGIKR